MIEIEVQNETHQTQDRVRFAAVPRIGEGLRLREPDGIWASYDVLDVWYQKAEYGDIWMPYLHVCMTPGERGETADGSRDAGDTPGNGAQGAVQQRTQHDVQYAVRPGGQGDGCDPDDPADDLDDEPDDTGQSYGELTGRVKVPALARELERFKI